MDNPLMDADTLQDFEPTRILRNKVTGKARVFPYVSINDYFDVVHALATEWTDDSELSAKDNDND